MLKKKEIYEELKSYSIVGDLISYLRCPHAYRKIKIGNLIPSRPSQLWFGNFVHSVMEQLFYLYQKGILIPIPLKPVCLKNREIEQNVKNIDDIDYFDLLDDIKKCQNNCIEKKCLYKICYDVIAKLAAQQIYARSRIMVKNAIFRINLLLNEIGTQLFPLIKAAEIPLKGIRTYEGKPLNEDKFKKLNKPKSIFYEIHGIVDVITQFKIDELKNIKNNNSLNFPRNIILERVGLELYPELSNETISYQNFLEVLIKRLNNDFPNGFEIILDYKGQIRPETTEESDWEKHDWQIKTYKWLREQQLQEMPVIAGILFYINEFFPSKKDLKNIIKSSEINNTDIPLPKEYIKILKESKYNPQVYIEKIPAEIRYNRSIRIIDLRDKNNIKKAIEKYDRTVLEIQLCQNIEKLQGTLDIWEQKGDNQMCGTCDFRYICKNYKIEAP
ncbi:MAG: PD-(D/E)XK nuclease family protein [Promethearchaeota archaeon]